MPITLEECRLYLRLDEGMECEDGIIETIREAAYGLCLSVARCPEEEFLDCPMCRTAILYAVGYLYEHREEADHGELTKTLRALLFPLREGRV